MRIRNCLFMMLVFTSVYSLGQVCQSGDCQQGAIAGPYSATQTAENTAPNFPQCVASSCATGPWNGNQIEGIDAQQNIGSQYQFYDSSYYNIDANIAVGPTVSGENAQVLEWVNGQYVQAFDKVTGQPIFTYGGGTTAVPLSVAILWSASTQPECQDSTGNVQVIYDRLDNVFAISRRITYSGVSGILHYAWCIALSSGSDLSKTTTSWYAYEYKMDTAIPCLPSSNNCTTGTSYYYYPDWPRIGTWSSGFYITFDLQNPTAGSTEAGFEACQLDRADMVLGQPANPMTCYTYMVPQNEEPSLIHSADVGDIDSATGPPNGEPEYFVSIVNPSNAQQGSNGQGVCTSKSTPCTSNQLALFTWGPSGLVGPTLVTVNPYTPGCYDTSRQGGEIITICVPVPSTNLSHIGGYGSLLCGDYGPPCLDSLGDRMANRLTYNNLSSSGNGPNGAYLTASHVVMESASNERTGIRYYILQVSNGTATVLVNSGGSSGPPDLQDPNATLFYFMPSAALDKNGNLAIVYTTSGAYCSSCQSQYNPAVNVEVLPWGASSFDPPTQIIQGTGDEENTMHWGEYAATVIDPTDNLTFYGLGEYFNTSQTGTPPCVLPSSNCYTWQTRIFRSQDPSAGLAVNPISLTFGPQVVGTTSPPQIATLTNTGTATLTLSSIGIVGSNSSDFAETNTCGPTLAPKDNCQVSVTFTPTAAGSRSAAVSITDNAPGSPQTVGLLGTTAVSLSPFRLTFPSQYVGTSGSPQTVTLTNTATTALTITSVTASPADFAPHSSCGSSIAPGASCSISVVFEPTTSGARNGVVTVTDSASDSPQTAALTGMGQDFAITLPGSVMATVAPGQTANYTLAVAPGGGFNQTVALSCSGAPPQSACSLSPSSIALNGSTPASVTVAVTTAGNSANLVHPAGFPPASGRLALWLALCGLPGLVLLGSGGRSRERQGRLLYGLAFLCLFSLGITLSACGGGNNSMGSSGGVTPAGSYNLTVTGTFTSGSTTLTHATKLTLVVQ
jgi:Transmembrane protein 131-like N-terminal/Abnormal spindle-like microcephaly-assoc'd, ASPM-SPD-2-Hydin